MSFFDFFKKKPVAQVAGTLGYIPGSTTPTQDQPITFTGGELQKRLYVQPNVRAETEYTVIPIYTGNPFRGTKVATDVVL